MKIDENLGCQLVHEEQGWLHRTAPLLSGISILSTTASKQSCKEGEESSLKIHIVNIGRVSGFGHHNFWGG